MGSLSGSVQPSSSSRGALEELGTLRAASPGQCPLHMCTAASPLLFYLLSLQLLPSLWVCLYVSGSTASAST